MSHGMWFEGEEIEYFSQSHQTPPEIQQEPGFIPILPQVLLSELIDDSALYYRATRDRVARIIVRSLDEGIPIVQAMIRTVEGNETVQRGKLLGCRIANQSNALKEGVLKLNHIPVLETLDGLSLLPKIISTPRVLDRQLRRFK